MPSPPPPPEVTAARPELPPSDWSPRPIPTPGLRRSTEDPKTPRLSELRARARRDSLLAATPVVADATRVARSPGGPPPPAHARPLAGRAGRSREPNAFAWDPLGRDRLTAAERARLGDLCRRGDCDKVQVYRGDGTVYANNLRADVLRVSQGRSVTLGNRIFLGDADRSDFAVLAHEVDHTTQYQRWGAVEYYNRGVGERISELLGGNPYGYRVDGRSFDAYGMEQQGKIVEDYVRGFPGPRRIPGVPRVGP